MLPYLVRLEKYQPKLSFYGPDLSYFFVKLWGKMKAVMRASASLNQKMGKLFYSSRGTKHSPEDMLLAQKADRPSIFTKTGTWGP